MATCPRFRRDISFVSAAWLMVLVFVLFCYLYLKANFLYSLLDGVSRILCHRFLNSVTVIGHFIENTYTLSHILWTVFSTYIFEYLCYISGKCLHCLPLFIIMYFLYLSFFQYLIVILTSDGIKLPPTTAGQMYMCSHSLAHMWFQFTWSYSSAKDFRIQRSALWARTKQVNQSKLSSLSCTLIFWEHSFHISATKKAAKQPHTTMRKLKWFIKQ